MNAICQVRLTVGRGLLALVCCAAAGCGGAERPEPPRHLLLVTVEGWRADRMALVAHGRETTGPLSPGEQRSDMRAWTIDDLVDGGVSWPAAYAPSPALMPALGALMSGRLPLESGLELEGEWLPGEQVSLAELCSAQGFETAAFVAARGRSFAQPLGQGFGLFEEHPDDAATIAAARAWFLARDAGAERATFLWLHLSGPAHPLDQESSDAPQPPPEFAGPAPLDTPLARYALEYDRAVWRAGQRLALFLEQCHDAYQSGAEAAEVWPRTATVLCGVAPVLLGEGGQQGSVVAFHESRLRVPLVLHHPPSLPGSRLQHGLVDLVDIVGTASDWFGFEAPPGATRRSLVAMARGDAQPLPPRRQVVCAYDRVFSIRDDRWRLVWNPLKRRVRGQDPAAPVAPTVSLHEIAADPLGLHELSGSDPSTVARLQAAIRDWRAERKPFPGHKKPLRLP